MGVQIRCRTKASRGSICFYNSTKATEDGLREDVHFSNCRITALRRGPLEVGGTLARRERALEPKPEVEEAGALDPLNADGSVVYDDGTMKKDLGHHDSVATTAPSESLGGSMQLTKSAAAPTTTANFFKPASPPGATRGGFRNTATTRGAFGKLGPSPSSSSAMFSGRPGAALEGCGDPFPTAPCARVASRFAGCHQLRRREASAAMNGSL